MGSCIYRACAVAVMGLGDGHVASYVCAHAARQRGVCRSRRVGCRVDAWAACVVTVYVFGSRAYSVCLEEFHTWPVTDQEVPRDGSLWASRQSRDDDSAWSAPEVGKVLQTMHRGKEEVPGDK